MSGYTQVNENKMLKLNGKKWYESLTPEQLAADFANEYKPNRLMKNILNWYEWYKGNMYIANGNELKSKGREPTDEERRNAILRSIELKNNLIDVEKYFNENKINMFNFNTYTRNNKQETKKRTNDLKDLMSILNYKSDSSNEEQQHSSKNKENDNVQEKLNKAYHAMEEETKQIEEENSFEQEMDLHKIVDMDKKPFIRKKDPIEKKMKPISFDKEYIKKEKKPKAMKSKRVVPAITIADD